MGRAAPATERLKERPGRDAEGAAVARIADVARRDGAASAVADRIREPAPPRPAQRPLRLAYLVNQYPMVSHTFIRRELLELERRGHHVLRLAVRRGNAPPVDPVDQRELARTLHWFDQPAGRRVLEAVRVGLSHPASAAAALRQATAMGRRSERGVGRHLAYLAEAAYFLQVLRRERIEHVHAHFGTNSAAVARLVRLLGGPPYSFTIHGPTEFDAPLAYSLGQKVKDAAFAVAISDYGAAQVRRWVPYEHWHKIHVVRCTVGWEFFDAPEMFDPDSKTLVCIGRLAPAKGHMLLIDALAMAVRRGVDARLVLAGDGELRGEIEQRVRAAGLEDRVEITGWIDEAEVRRRVLQSRALVMASFAEGLPMVIMEAMALSRPVIATCIAGIPELVVPGETGWLVTAGRADQLADAMEELFKAPPSHLIEMGRSGRRRVHERHFTPTEGERLERLLIDAVRNNGGGRGGR